MQLGPHTGFAIAMLITATGALAQTTAPEAVAKAVSLCLSIVHNTRPAENWMQQFYTNFDALYNSAADTVQNNALSTGDMKALFVFNKCMAAQGYPLK